MNPSIMKMFTAMLLVAMCLMANEIGGPMVEARTCETRSHKFKGTCFSDTNCANVCHSEGFPDGKCRGFRRRCFCTRPC
ncbi:hypothetical protein M8C21_006452 [Ambrosia artemisiifolia]|uniref:Knottins-like domain-containing protein n=1 Tax=Ambrosia artemisiifolia TaxID=4212 RepID=A0AAD5C4D3_AMBAR|nr:hypothetical protein M8C21_006452 [Ambrosia artemisiifolia]